MSVRTRYHEIAGELYGRLAARCLLRLAVHAHKIGDTVSYERARDVLSYGVKRGWNPDEPTRHLRAGQTPESELSHAQLLERSEHYAAGILASGRDHSRPYVSPPVVSEAS